MSPPRAAVYNRFWHSQGGGERHSGMIAQVLSQDGLDVDLLGHTDVDRDELAEHLGLDLSRCRLRIVPDRGDYDLANLSADYDLFVNGSYMSRLSPRARRNAYLCYFPTPFDFDLGPTRRALARRVGRYVRAHAENIDFGTGWFPPEGGRRRQWIWTSGDAVLVLPPGPPKVLRLDLGAPGRAEPRPLRIEDEKGNLVRAVDVGPAFRTERIALPERRHGDELHFRSGTFTPGGGDDRTLGVAVSRIRFEGAGFGPRERLAGRYPWLLRDATDLRFLAAYDCVLANSEYTRGWIRELWQTDSDVLFPPIQVQRLHPRPERSRSVVSVGRFFAPGLGHAKKQLEMVRFFGDAVRGGRLADTTLWVLGGCEDSQRPYLDQVRAAAAGLPVQIVPNAPRAQVEELLSSATVFWSATGYGQDERKAPWSSEHFGMTTVEAMAGGCVPVVIDQAGQKEIVREGVDGFRWRTPAQLVDRTSAVLDDPELRARLAGSATQRARQFSETAFADRWHAIAAERALLP